MTRPVLLFALGSGILCAQDGAAIFKARCAGCHDAPEGRTPSTAALRTTNPLQIVRALETGVMKTQAEGLSSLERYALLAYLLTPTSVTPPPPASAFCTGKASALSAQGPRWSGWSVDSSNSRFQNNAGLSANDVPKLKLKWAFALGKTTVARSQPSVAGGRLFFGSETGIVYSLDARSGCIYWTFDAGHSVRSAVLIGTEKQPAAYFGAGPFAYSLDAATGKLRWKVQVEEHFAARITGAPALHGDVLYMPVASIEEGLPPLPSYECCTFRGSVVALDTATGKQIWKTYTIAEAPQPTKRSKTGAQMHGPSGAGIWSTPTFDEKRDAIYVATGDNYSEPTTNTSDAVLALDRKTGKIVWSKQLTANDAYNNGCGMKINCPDTPGPDYDFGQPPILVSLANGKRALVIGQKSGIVHALDPDQQGEILWQTRVGQGSPLGGMQWGSAADRDNIYAALSDVKIKGIVLDKDVPEGFRMQLDPDQGGGLFALRLATGEKVWGSKTFPCGDRKNCSPAQSAAVTAIPGAVFSGALDGHLRAYSSSTGEVLWDVDTIRDYETVNGQTAHGGSLDGPGAAIAGGMLYVNSGYGQFGGTPGNVLLAFSIDGK